MSTDALELALALHQAPIQRFALRDRPLPTDIGVALQLASAAQPQLGQAAARFQESEETIVEAVRFYLQQVLFEPGTDAYRILGLTPAAEFKQIRQHHIWLQRWLHPDRRGEDWEAALATKINWAWQQLRNETSREEYNRTRRSGAAQQAAEAPAVEPVQVPMWNAAPIKPARHWMRRLAMAAVLVFCMGLFYLAATRQDRVDPDGLALQSGDTDSAIRPRLHFDADAIHRPQLPEPPPAIVASPRSASVRTDGPASMIPEESEAPTRPATPAPSPDSQVAAADDKPGTEVDAIARLAPPGDRAGRAAALPAAPNAMKRVSLPTARPAEPAMAKAAVLAAAPGQQVPATADAACTVAPPRPEPHAGQRELVVAPQPVDDRRESARREVSATVERASSAALRTPAGGSEGQSVAVAPIAVARSVEQVAAAAEIEPSPTVELEPAATELPVEAVAVAPVARETLPTPPPSRATPELDRETLARFEMARERLRSMISYFRSANGDPPDWNDEPGRHTAARERELLHGRNTQSGVDGFALDPPVWQISHTAVGLKADYHVGAKLASAESGRFLLDMVWQDGNWKITRIEVSPRR